MVQLSSTTSSLICKDKSDNFEPKYGIIKIRLRFDDFCKALINDEKLFSGHRPFDFRFEKNREIGSQFA